MQSQQRTFNHDDVDGFSNKKIEIGLETQTIISRFVFERDYKLQKLI